MVIKTHSRWGKWLAIHGRPRSSRPVGNVVVHFQLVLRNNPRLTNDNDNDRREQACSFSSGNNRETWQQPCTRPFPVNCVEFRKGAIMRIQIPSRQPRTLSFDDFCHVVIALLRNESSQVLLQWLQCLDYNQVCNNQDDTSRF